MGVENSHEISMLLAAWSKGDQAALGSLIPCVERELRRIAKRRMDRERRDPTLDTTALINEVYVRLIDAAQVSWRGRAHFFAACATIMRRILIDAARARCASKRGGGGRPLSLEEAAPAVPDRAADLVAIEDALNSLSEVDPRRARVVELRFFGGLSVDETAEALGASPATVMRDWNVAKLWLMRELTRGGASWTQHAGRESQNC